MNQIVISLTIFGVSFSTGGKYLRILRPAAGGLVIHLLRHDGPIRTLRTPTHQDTTGGMTCRALIPVLIR